MEDLSAGLKLMVTDMYARVICSCGWSFGD